MFAFIEHITVPLAAPTKTIGLTLTSIRHVPVIETDDAMIQIEIHYFKKEKDADVGLKAKSEEVDAESISSFKSCEEASGN